MVEPHSSTFRVITPNILGVGIFRKFTVLPNRELEGTLDKAPLYLAVLNAVHV